MSAHARWLFGTAASVNFIVGLGLLFLRPWVAPILHLDPTYGTNLVFANFAGCLIALFGVAYFRLAVDPIKYRLYVSFSVIGKSLAVLCIVSAWAMGAISWILPALVSIDVVYSLLFLDFLRRYRPA